MRKNNQKKEKGFTLVELIVSSALSIVVVVYIFNVVLMIKDLYITNGIKTNLLLKQNEIVAMIEDSFLEKELTLFTVSNEEVEFLYDDLSTKILSYNKGENYIEFDNKRVYLEKGVTIGNFSSGDDIIVEKVTDSAYNSILSFNLPITHNYVEGDYGINIVHPYNYCGISSDPLKIENGVCIIDVDMIPVLRKSNSLSTFLNTSISNATIEEVKIVSVSSFPSGAIDVSDKQNETVKLWSKDDNSNGMLEIYIGAINSVVYANPDSNRLFGGLNLLSKMDLSNFDTRTATDMNQMFASTATNSSAISINFGNKFDTSSVTNMGGMFSNFGTTNQNLILKLGNKFDTGKVTNMINMFYRFGNNAPKITLDLGDKFDTSSVTTMGGMFDGFGYHTTQITFDLGNKFDTSKVIDMQLMFSSMAVRSTNFTLDLKDKFDTSNVTNMDQMFNWTAMEATNFKVNLGNKFDTSKVTNMNNMFAQIGYRDANFVLDLKNKFDTSNVTNMSQMFLNVGSGSSTPSKFTLNLGNKFDTSNVTNMDRIFQSIGARNPAFTLDLGNKFKVDLLTSYVDAFNSAGNSNPSFKPKATVKTQAEKNAILAKFPNIDVTVNP